jgi:uncharacterized protein (TIGR02118 family)
VIKVSVMYPATEGAGFDMDYYCNKHMPLVQERCGDALKGMQIEAGLSGPAPGTPATYVCMGHLLFESPEAFAEAFTPHVGEIMGDIANYTAIAPVIQISEVKL